MKLQPIINAKLNAYKKAYNLENKKDGIVFERYVNQAILTSHQPSAFSVEDDLLDLICVGGFNDMGIDGIAIKINGKFIKTEQDVKDIIDLYHKIDIEFIFVQSKYREKFDSGEYAKFINGVTDFLSEQHFQPRNSQIDAWLSIKNFLLNDDTMVVWKDNPLVRLYYVVMGDWNNSLHIKAITDKFIQEIGNLQTYGQVYVNYLDICSFKKLCDENENLFTSVVNYIESLSLPEVDNVDNSMVILSTAEELLKLIVSEEDILRKGIFNDNVRDYQGDTTINNEIMHTIESDPQSFVLLNNGITIVCDEIIPGNRKVTIRNPQIVNGCQTCSVLFNAKKKGADISKIMLCSKLIATDSDDITNKIVKGTNRQNIVYDEAFEITKEFHKQLEELFNTLSADSKEKIYYERRSKQYFQNSGIKPSQKINFRILIQSFVSIFLDEPHNGHRHESKLLSENRNKIFIDSQSKLPYYTSALIYLKLDNLIRGNQEFGNKGIKTYKAHIALLVKELIGGRAPSINKEKDIDNYCNKILKKVEDETYFLNTTKKSVKIFNDIQSKWVKEKGESFRYGIKDSQEFTKYLLDSISSNRLQSSKNRGTVIKIGFDVNGFEYGFISKLPDNIFFHSNENRHLDFSELLDKDVLYDVKIDERYNKEKAVNVEEVN